ncbi:MAG: UDP-N-acetylmuramate dehydrogenase [Helicobacter sp.]|nr:UDP-N-acetylmuramate dehydrogenase [Helicobacter sp.]
MPSVSSITLDLSRYTHVRIGGVSHVAVLHTPCEQNYQLLGHGYNLLVSPETRNLAILGDEFATLAMLPNGLLRVGAALPAYKLYAYAKRNDLRGFEFLAHLPGSIGGLVKMNAGMSLATNGAIARYEIRDVLAGIATAKHDFIDASTLGLGYRTSNISETIYAAFFHARRGFRHALLAEFAKLRRKQPKGARFGSAFKNPPGDFAGRLIESVGLKGVRFGNVCFSEKHANFLINTGDASFDEAKALLDEAKRRVFDTYGITLQEEVVILT